MSILFLRPRAAVFAALAAAALAAGCSPSERSGSPMRPDFSSNRPQDGAGLIGGAPGGDAAPDEITAAVLPASGKALYAPEQIKQGQRQSVPAKMVDPRLFAPEYVKQNEKLIERYAQALLNGDLETALSLSYVNPGPPGDPGRYAKLARERAQELIRELNELKLEYGPHGRVARIYFDASANYEDGDIWLATVTYAFGPQPGRAGVAAGMSSEPPPPKGESRSAAKLGAGERPTKKSYLLITVNGGRRVVI